jgi:hypothetical protein
MVLKQPSKRRTGDNTQVGFLNNIVSTNPGKIVPIVSNSFRVNQIFCDEKQLSNFVTDNSKQDDNTPTIEQQLTEVWAKDINYPMGDPDNLARVIQYVQIENKDNDIAKKEYINFLKSYLLDMASEEEAYREIVENLIPERRTLPFTEIARQLKYPRFHDSVEDPLSLLAKLPFPTYITTSYFDFLERALVKAGNKNPRTCIIRWNESHYSKAPEYPDPTVGEPIVYHLFGIESDPASLVISEDDYLKFLVRAVSDIDKHEPIIPLWLQRTLASSHLLLLGYQLKEWDFRVLFRFILNYRTAKPGKTGIFIQVKPEKGDPHLVGYLSRYFDIEDFEIEWKTPEKFIQELWQVWKGREE